ncbi:hypothetical protein PC116_g28556 [Phytophthora cactorum]|uniref:Uncharacterized protein n=1 Tax=Phytophthora cactorum TaxID=29920 RepID=A0A8T1JLG7_9STRA|nr:hypothetical protein PC117_g26675 [Phytophthora cactorum]KAG2959965.1 hypothetical protein PC119_g26546 [Phytophthora cactorum]KAG3184974.1 hypothetical protein PC128_g13503 [Phytophthora cactorum]KAG4222971.1 hypothetical protein PC116_g28556 [Phytophthora cactorum]
MRDSAGFQHREELDGARIEDVASCWIAGISGCGRGDCLRLRMHGRLLPVSVDDCCMCFVEECSTKLVYLVYLESRVVDIHDC